MKYRDRPAADTYRSILEDLPDIVLILSEDGTLQYINHIPGGGAPDQAVGKSIYEHIQPEDRDYLRNILAKVFRTGAPNRCQVSVIGPRGERQWYANRIKPIERDGQVIAAVVVTTDITREKDTAGEAAAPTDEEHAHAVSADLLPVCAWCKRVRDDNGFWEKIEEYLRKHTGSAISHGMCPECRRTHFPEFR
jgi:PAS domain S-box-containing protein